MRTDVEKCSACGWDHQGIHFEKNKDGKFEAICPRKGAKIYLSGLKAQTESPAASHPHRGRRVFLG